MRKNLILSLIAFLTLSVGLVSNQTKKVEEVKAAEQLPEVQEGYRRIFWHTLSITDSEKYGIHYYGGKSESAWPGKLATQIDGSLYYCDIDATSTGVNFTRLNATGKEFHNKSNNVKLNQSNVYYSGDYFDYWENGVNKPRFNVYEAPSLIGSFASWKPGEVIPFTYNEKIKALAVDVTFTTDVTFKTFMPTASAYFGFPITSGSKVSIFTTMNGAHNQDGSISTGSYTIALGNFSKEYYIIESQESIMKKDIAELEKIGYEYTLESYNNAKAALKELSTTYSEFGQKLDYVEETLVKVEQGLETLSQSIGLSLKAQQTAAVEDKATFRMIGLVKEVLFAEGSNYDIIGFTINIGKNTLTWKATDEYENYNKVYKGVVADGQTILATELGYDYCFGLELTNVPVGTELVVTSVLSSSTAAVEDLCSLSYRYVVGSGNQPTRLLY